MTKFIVYKVAMQRTNIKFISTGYNTWEMIKKDKVVSVKVTSVHVMCFLVYSEFNKSTIEIGLCIQFFAKLVPNNAIFH